MPSLSPHTCRLDEEDFDFNPKEMRNWSAHESRHVKKAHKRTLSINRQLDQGAPIEAVRTKILGLHRQCTAYNGNGSYDDLSLRLGIEPRPNVKVPKSRTEIDDSEERMVQRIDNLLDQTAKAYRFYTADEVRPPPQQQIG